jgi:hypothetical protein
MSKICLGGDSCVRMVPLGVGKSLSEWDPVASFEYRATAVDESEMHGVRWFGC